MTTNHSSAPARPLAAAIWSTCRRCGALRYLAAPCMCHVAVSTRRHWLTGFLWGLAAGIGGAIWFA